MSSHSHAGELTKHGHQPVLLASAIRALQIDPHGFYIDATYGRGGHSREILCRLAADGRLLAFDKDPEAYHHARSEFGADARFEIRQGSFTGIRQIKDEGGMNQIAGILFDLGVSSPQLEDPDRGFSFQNEGPLDMRMDPETGVSALEWLNNATVSEIKTVLKTYGEERNAAKIAKAIKSSPTLYTTLDLASLVAAVSSKFTPLSKNPATRTFLALRLYLNRELEDLREALSEVPDLLRIGGRLVTISFHSLEDRIIKRFVRRFSNPKRAPAKLPIADDYSQVCLKKIGRPITPDMHEISQNHRARSARLRIAEKIAKDVNEDRLKNE